MTSTRLNRPNRPDRPGERRRPRPAGPTHLAAIAVTAITVAAVAASCGGGAPQARPPQPPATATSTMATPTTSSTPATQVTVGRPIRPTVDREQAVDVGDTRVHIRCHGAGASTVVLISGFETGSEAWASVEPTLAARTRVCVYDRPGTGTSGPPTAPQTFSSQAAALRTLLDAVGEPGPYVAVGHSFGGPEAIAFASRFAGDVEAVVLVDASPSDWPTALCAVADDGSDAAVALRGLCDGWADPNGNAEHLDVFAAFDLVAATPSLGTVPVTVLTAVDRELPDGIAADERERLTDLWDRGQQRWADLSSDSRIVPVADSGHYVQLDHPDLVIDEITRALP